MSGVSEERQKLHFSSLCSTFSPILLSSPWCLSLQHNVSASRVSSTVWSPPLPLHVCPHTIFFLISILTHYYRLYFLAPRCPLFWSFSKSPFLSGSEFRGGWESLSSKLSGPAKGHRPDHLGWLWTEPAAVISGAQSGREPKKDDKNRVFASDKMVRLLGNRQDVKSATS